MKVLVDSRIRLEGIGASDPVRDSVIDALQQRFTYENPVYWDARRFRHPCRNIPRRIELFEIDGDTGSCPRGALGEVLRLTAPLAPEVIDLTICPPCTTVFPEVDLRDYQAAAVEAILAVRQGVLQAPTGSGKTVVAMGAIARLQTPTIILVHTSILFEQTIDRIRDFLGIQAGRIGGGHEDVGDVTVAMVQTLMRRDVTGLASHFGCVILDEAHHCPAETFKSVVQRFPARYRIGLTATPNRKDRLHPVLFDTVGPIVHAVQERALVASGSLARTEVIAVQTPFRGWYRDDYQGLINRLVANAARNAVVLDSIGRYHMARSLVLTERVSHCDLLTEALAGRGMKVAGIHGQVAREQRDALVSRFVRGDIEVLVATTSLIGEGFDLPAIDTVFLTVPNGNVAKTTQALGRALRPSKGKISGRIVDFVDENVPLLLSQYRRRSKVYQRFEQAGGSR